MSRYKELFDEMISKNRELFIRFKIIHDLYSQDPKKNESQFNKLGGEVMEIIREYEDKLCGYSEQGSYSKFSANLSEKFWTEVRKNYPKIDFLGIRRSA